MTNLMTHLNAIAANFGVNCIFTAIAACLNGAAAPAKVDNTPAPEIPAPATPPTPATPAPPVDDTPVDDPSKFQVGKIYVYDCHERDGSDYTGVVSIHYWKCTSRNGDKVSFEKIASPITGKMISIFPTNGCYSITKFTKKVAICEYEGVDYEIVGVDRPISGYGMCAAHIFDAAKPEEYATDEKLYDIRKIIYERKMIIEKRTWGDLRRQLKVIWNQAITASEKFSDRLDRYQYLFDATVEIEEIYNASRKASSNDNAAAAPEIPATPASDATPAPEIPSTPSTPASDETPASTLETQVRGVVNNWADNHLIVACAPNSPAWLKQHCKDLRAGMIDKMTADEISRVNAEKAAAPATDDPTAVMEILADLSAGALACKELSSMVKKGCFNEPSGALITAVAFTDGAKSEATFSKALDALKKLYAKNPAIVKAAVDVFKNSSDPKLKKAFRAIIDFNPCTFNFIAAE